MAATQFISAYMHGVEWGWKGDLREFDMVASARLADLRI